MNNRRLLGQGISFPPRIGDDGRFMWSSGSENIRESIRVLLMTERRERVMLPGYGGGLRAFLMEPNTTATHRLIQERVQQALARWIPRIKLVSVTVKTAEDDPQGVVVDIQYRLTATGAEDALTLTVQVGG